MTTQNNQAPPTFKLVLVGDGGVGKSAMVTKLMTGTFQKKYIPTLGVEVYSITFSTNYGPIRFNVWDTAGQEKFAGLGSGYYVQADAAIGVFDLDSRITLKNVESWIRNVRETRSNIPIAVCGNKCDLVQHKVTLADIEEWVSDDHSYYETSAKNGQITGPFIYVARQVTGYPDLVFT